MKIQSSLPLLAAVWTTLIAVPVLLGTPPALAGDAKVEVCHRPPGDLDNFHTIRISANALSAHLAHGDLPEACNAACATLCDDQNECTVDDTGDCDLNGCPIDRAPTNCDDGFACTTDSCDPATGCEYEPSIVCDAPDLCTMSTCAEPEGMCMDTPLSCNEGQTCNPDTGNCEDTAPADCPCAETWANGVGLPSIIGRDLSPPWTCSAPPPPLSEAVRASFPKPGGFPFPEIIHDFYQLKLIIRPDIWECSDGLDIDIFNIDRLDVPGLSAAEWTACKDLLAAQGCVFP
jgi:hypothetical protein